MRVAIMQPYLLPFLGYWQLMDAVDTFVLFDDVNYIKKGYINRNSILLNGSEHRFTLELEGSSQNKLINEIKVGRNGMRLLKTMEHAYKKAPGFPDVFPLLERIFLNSERNLSNYLEDSIHQVMTYLNINIPLISSSQLRIQHGTKGQERIILICKALDATHYVNAIGGKLLYDPETFSVNNLAISFLESNPITYAQSGSTFVPNLSIVDVLMFNHRIDCSQLLQQYQLV